MIITDENIIDEILERGTIVEILPDLKDFKDELMSGKRLSFYIGFDATAPTLHLSHAKNLILLEKFRKLGHEVIVLFGDFTAMIGDPSDRDSKRSQLTREEVLNNFKEWKKLIFPLMDFDTLDNPPIIKFNSEWLSKFNFQEVLELASNLTVNQLLERNMFKQRMSEEKPIFMNEFLYPMLQGYDSVAMNIDVELCGTDQIFNALVGRTFQRRFNNKNKFVVAVTLMEDPITGELMSKSNGTGVFLDASPNDMYGQIMSQTDQMIPILFLNNTLLEKNEIDDILKLGPRDAKMRLAKEIVKIFYSSDYAEIAEQEFINTIQNKSMPKEIPIVEFNDGTELREIVKKCRNISGSQANRLIEQGAVSINGIKILENDFIISFNDENILKIGKRGWFKIVSK